MRSLELYYQLLDRVDHFCASVRDRFPQQMACRRGCDSCCTHIGVMAVEAISLALAVAALPDAEAKKLRTRARRMRKGKNCPLLDEGACLLYAVRPIICRTQGLPLLLAEDGRKRVDHCPLNFRGLDSLPGETVLNLENLNQSLVAVNLHWLGELSQAASGFPERIAVAEALLLEVDARAPNASSETAVSDNPDFSFPHFPSET